MIFEMPVTPGADDMDVNGHVNNIVYLRWVQDIAGAHWHAVARADWQARFTWVVLRHEIEYLKPCFAGDALVLRTHVGGARGARFDRFVDVLRGDEICAKARTSWAMIDLATGRPARVPPEMISCFADASEVQ
jgi:acyl-CoA thioester hydrolase